MGTYAVYNCNSDEWQPQVVPSGQSRTVSALCSADEVPTGGGITQTPSTAANVVNPSWTEFSYFNPGPTSVLIRAFAECVQQTKGVAADTIISRYGGTSNVL